jgi:predicted transcriptional regulator
MLEDITKQQANFFLLVYHKLPGRRLNIVSDKYIDRQAFWRFMRFLINTGYVKRPRTAWYEITDKGIAFAKRFDKFYNERTSKPFRWR